MEDGRDYDIFDKLIEGKQPFALFKRPGEGSVNLILQENRFQNEVFELDKIGDYSGFAVCPFNISRKTPLIVIQPDIYLKGENCIFEHLKQNSIYPGNTPINISGYKGVNVGKPERCAGSERLASSKSGKISLVPKEYFELYKNNFEIFHTVLQ
jgi:hypothetical protein